MRILFVSSNSRDDYLDIEREQRAMLNLAAQGNHYVKLLPAARIADLERELGGADGEVGSFDVLHFAGHGSKQGIELKSSDDEFELDEDLQVEPLDADRLADIVKAGREKAGLKLVVLNACDTRTLVETIAGLVDQVIGTTRDIQDRAAKQFTSKFYGALNAGETIADAYRQAAVADGPYLPLPTALSDLTLPPSDKAGKGKVEGLGAFYEAFYGRYIDKQIEQVQRDHRLNNYVFGGLLAIAVCVWIYLFQTGADGSTSGAFWPNLKDALADAFYPGSEPGEPDLFSMEGLWARVEHLEAFAPVVIAFFQRTFFFSTRPKLEGLRRLRDCVRNWDDLPDEDREMIRSAMHTSLKESLQQ